MSELALKLIEENKKTKNPFLDLGNCGLKDLPNEIFECTWLTVLNLGDFYYDQELKKYVESANGGALNSLENINSKIISNLTNLYSLYLSFNKVNDLSFLLTLKDLKALDISYNKITDITYLMNSIGLQSLDLSNNQITDISPIFPLIKKGIFINLRSVYIQNEIGLGNNPITKPPMEIVRQGKEAIIRYFAAGSLIPLNECKLIFVGDGGVGKTCLMKRIVYDIFNDNEKQTHGINKIVWKDIKNDKNENVKVNLWDFGGQEIQHSLHQFFFSERVIYILVLNPRNDEKAPYWMEQIEKLGFGSEVLIVYNWREEMDKNSPFLNKFYELRKKYNKLADPFVLSVKTGDGINEFKEGVNKAVLRNEGLVHAYPQKWFNIKNKLEEYVTVGKNYVDYDEYQKWCEEFDYPDEDDQKALLVILNMIGSVVFFDRPILNRFQVLNPEWITTGAYSVLTSQITMKKKGHLSIKDLKIIFKDEKEIFSNKEIRIKYTEIHFHFIIQLMREYNLCQENPFNRNEYLIPSAFGEKPAKDYKEHKTGSREYRIQFDSPFEMLIIHRFIARNLSKAQGEDYWQSGVFIKDSGSKTFALIETNLLSYRIDLWIKGEDIRGFWDTLRRDFCDIFSIYKNFNYREEVLYKKDYIEVFLPYKEMLDCLKNGVKIIEYHPTYCIRGIDVLEVLSMFEGKEETDEKIKIVQPYHMEEIDDTINMYKQRNSVYKNSKFRLWKRNSKIIFFISLILTLLVWFVYISEPIFITSEETWSKFKKSEYLWILGVVLSFVWNSFVVKLFYDRHYDPSKEKAFKDNLEIPKNIK